MVNLNSQKRIILKAKQKVFKVLVKFNNRDKSLAKLQTSASFVLIHFRDLLL